jgi:hypothetical protein
METKHTEAPWQVRALGGGLYSVETHTHTEVFGEDEIGRKCKWAERSMATASLIAAAPDLLRVLMKVEGAIAAGYITNQPSSGYDWVGEIIEQAQIAISLAVDDA